MFSNSVSQDKLANLQAKISEIGAFDAIGLNEANGQWTCTAYSRTGRIVFQEAFATEEDADQCAIMIIDSRTVTQSE